MCYYFQVRITAKGREVKVMPFPDLMRTKYGNGYKCRMTKDPTFYFPATFAQYVALMKK